MISIEYLKRFEIFNDLTESEAEIIRERSELKQYDKDKRIFAENSLATNLYLLLEGKVEIRLNSSKKNADITIDIVKPNEIFGWSAVTDPHTFTAAAWTMENSKMIAINGEGLHELFKINNQLGYKVMKKISSLISRRLRHLNKKMVESIESN